MKINKRILLVFFTLFYFFQTSGYAQVTLPKVFGDNMVLQRGIKIPVWDNATSDSLIVATLMKKNSILILSFLSLMTDMVHCQIKKSADVSCIQLSNIKYLIIVENGTDRSLFLPTNAIVQKYNDTLFVDYKFSYQHHISTVYRYKVDGSEFETNTLLDNDIKPDIVYKESKGYIPNFAVPSALFELKPHNKHIYRIANSENQQPRKFAVSLFSQKNDAEGSKQANYLGLGTPCRKLK